MHESVNEWVSYGTQRTWRQVRSGVGGGHRASLYVTMDGYMRRGKAGLKIWRKDLGGVIARCVTYAAWRCLFRYRVRVTGVRLVSGQIVHEQRRVQREKETKCDI